MYIEMPRGDYRPLYFPLKKKDGTILEIDVDEIYISCKKKTNNVSKLLFQKRHNLRSLILRYPPAL